MAVDALKSTALTNADATPLVFNNARIQRMPLWEATGSAQATASASIASIYRLVRVPSNARISQVLLSCDGFDTTGLADVGVYASTVDGSAVVDADLFASATSLVTAIVDTNVTHESAVFGIEDAEKPLWEALGLSADPMVDYDIAVTLTEANGAGNVADITLKVRYGL